MSRFALVVGTALVLAGPACAAGPFDDLLKFASTNTNAIVLIDARSAFASEVAKKEKWTEQSQQIGYAGLGFVPSGADRLAIAAEINFTTMVRDFQVGLVKVDSVPNLKRLATREGGTTDEIAGQLVAVSPRDVYFTSFPGRIFAAVHPADRQYTARWIRSHRDGRAVTLAPFLRKAADNAGESTVVIALDLEDVLEPAAIRFGLQFSPIMVRSKLTNQNALSLFLGRVKGLTFSAKVTDGVLGKVVVEFPGDVNRFRGILKDLFLELIDGYGIGIDGMEKWEATFTDTTMTLTGSMTPGDLKRIVTLFSFPQPGQTEEEPMTDEPTVGATQRYLRAVDIIIDDIRQVRVRDDGNNSRTATWHDNAAAQLEQLSRRNVDPLAVDAVYQTSKRLRAIAASLRGVPVDIDALAQQAFVYSERSPMFWGGWGGWGRRGFIRNLAFAPSFATTNVPEIQSKMAKVVADDKKRRNETWNQIDQIMTDTRRKLGDKYKAKF